MAWTTPYISIFYSPSKRTSLTSFLEGSHSHPGKPGTRSDFPGGDLELLRRFFFQSWAINHMVVSINGGSLKWMVYNGKSHFNRWLRGTPISGNFHINSFYNLGWVRDLQLSHPRCCCLMFMELSWPGVSSADAALVFRFKRSNETSSFRRCWKLWDNNHKGSTGGWCSLFKHVFFHIYSGWWFGTFFIFPYIGSNHPNWLSFFSEGFKPPTSIVASYLTINFSPFASISPVVSRRLTP